MNFYKRYAETCINAGIEPCSQKAAELFKVTKATISSWNKNGTTPKGETVALIANKLDVSTDYLLEITNIPKIINDTTIEEQELLELYRASSDQDKNTIMKIATALSGGKVKDKDIQETSSNLMIG